MSSALTFIPWILISVVIGALNITSAIYLLRERHMGPMLMLAGSGIALLGQLGQIAGTVVMLFGYRSAFITNSTMSMLAVSALATLGTLLFSIGLLLHALHQRGKANRIAELEAILNSRSE